MSPLMIFALLSSWFVEPADPTTLIFPPFGHCMNIYRAGSDQLALMLGGMVSFEDPQGLACVKLDEWNSPGPGDDDELTVYGTNSRSGHIIYNATMYSLGVYGGTGSGPDQLLGPHGIAATVDGMVLVADTGNGRIIVLRRSEARLRPDGQLFGDLVEPWDVALDGSGSIYATDRAGGKLLVYSSLSDSMPSEVLLDMPRGVAATGHEPWSSGHPVFQAVVVGDGSALVKIMDGEITASVEPAACGGSFFNYPDIDYFGNIWVTDSISCKVHKFNSDLEYLASMGEPGTEDDQFDHPTGIAIWNRFGQIFVAENEGARYFWVGTDFRDIHFAPSGSGFSLSAVLTEPANIVATVLNSNGEEIRKIHNGRFTGRNFELEWDGRGISGTGLPAGDYTIQIIIEPTYSSRGYFTKTFRQTFSMEETTSEQPTGGRRGR